MANGMSTKQIGNWFFAGVGLTLGVIATKTVLNFVRGVIPVPIADV